MAREFTHEEMLARLEKFGGEKFTMTDFRDHYEAFCEGGDCEDAETAADIRSYYPNLCAGMHDEREWHDFVSETFWNLYDCEILVPHFPRD